MTDLSVVAKEVFQAIDSFDYTMRLYDDKGMTVVEPADARRFMCMPKNIMVSLVDDDDNTRLTFQLGKSVHINDVMGLDQRLRALATKYNIIFNAEQSNRHITPRNFAAMASVKEDFVMHVCEGMYGTSRSSYLRLENARMIVRHKSRIDDSKIGARGRCVESVFIENSIGERSHMPTNSLMAGRAMTQHVNQGGAFADPVGQQITEMAVQYGNLATGVGAAVGESAGMLREACRAKMGKLRKTFERLYRPNSYTAEAEAIAAAANMLTETKLSESRIDEVRRMLDDCVSDEVVECCCKAMDDAKPVTEARLDEMPPRPIPTKTILGKPVGAVAWDDFMHDNHLSLIGEPQMSDEPTTIGGVGRTWSKVVQLANKLSSLADVVQDDGLSNLFRQVADEMPDERNPEKARIYRAIALKALKAAAHGNRLAENNEVIATHFTWLSSFDPDKRLVEVGHYDVMDPFFDTRSYDDAASHAIDNFDPTDFLHSEAMQDIISGREPHSEENHLERDEVMQALESYLRHSIDMAYPDQMGAFDDVSNLAEEVYDQAVGALHHAGYVVDDEALTEEAVAPYDIVKRDDGYYYWLHRGGGTQGPFDSRWDAEVHAQDSLDESLNEEDELTIEDVLLPKHNQGDDLAGEVTKADITDPDDPEQHGAVDSSYTSRLMTLAGMNNSGQSGPGY